MAHVGYGTNEYGTPVSMHVCDTCGREFTLCPAQPPDDSIGDDCLGTECASYDASRDFGLMLEGNISPIGGIFVEDRDGNVSRVRPGKS